MNGKEAIMLRNIIASALVLCSLAGPARADQPPVPVNQPQTEAERKAFAPGDKSPAAIVNAFNQMAFFDHHPIEAMKHFLSDDFIERSPDFARDGYASDKAGIIAYFETRGWKAGDTMKDTIYQVIAQDDRAVVFHKVTLNDTDRGVAFVDIFRVRDGLIVEHWAISQPIAANVTPRHSMF